MTKTKLFIIQMFAGAGGVLIAYGAYIPALVAFFASTAFGFKVIHESN